MIKAFVYWDSEERYFETNPISFFHYSWPINVSKLSHFDWHSHTSLSPSLSLSCTHTHISLYPSLSHTHITHTIFYSHKNAHIFLSISYSHTHIHSTIFHTHIQNKHTNKLNKENFLANNHFIIRHRKQEKGIVFNYNDDSQFDITFLFTLSYSVMRHCFSQQFWNLLFQSFDIRKIKEI